MKFNKLALCGAIFVTLVAQGLMAQVDTPEVEKPTETAPAEKTTEEKIAQIMKTYNEEYEEYEEFMMRVQKIEDREEARKVYRSELPDKRPATVEILAIGKANPESVSVIKGRCLILRQRN